MKDMRLIALLVSVFAINVTNAIPLTPDEILLAIDGESDAPYQVDANATNPSPFVSYILSAIDGESDQDSAWERPSRVNFDLSNGLRSRPNNVDTLLPDTYD
ncbi:MAG TPA: hypothetical protein ENJ33_04265 [Thiothrix sp.]|nr:hypothetical protein [Thiothrix sp.]